MKFNWSSKPIIVSKKNHECLSKIVPCSVLDAFCVVRSYVASLLRQKRFLMSLIINVHSARGPTYSEIMGIHIETF